jgi:hypothetical protein
MTSTQAIGLTNMTHRHPGPSVRTPPSRIPIAEDSPAMAAHTPSAGWRSRGVVNVVVRVDNAAGSISAAPSPCARRAPMNTPASPANPPTSEDSPTTIVPASRTLRRPSRSASRPPSSMNPPYVSRYAEGTHCRLCTEKRREVRMRGSATFVIDASTKSRNATAQRSARIRRPCQLCSASGGETVVIQNSYVGSANIGLANISGVGRPNNC